jgi:hypothetical protein
MDKKERDWISRIKSVRTSQEMKTQRGQRSNGDRQPVLLQSTEILDSSVGESARLLSGRSQVQILFEKSKRILVK